MSGHFERVRPEHELSFVRVGPIWHARSVQYNRLLASVELFFLDILMLCTTIYLSLSVATPLMSTSQVIRIDIFITLLYLVCAFNGGAYMNATILSPSLSVYRSLRGLFFAFLLVLAGAFTLKLTSELPRFALSSSVLCGAIALAAARSLYTARIVSLTGGRLSNELVIVDGVEIDTSAANCVYDAAAFNLRPDLNNPVMLHRFGTLIRDFDRVIVACEESRRVQWAGILKVGEVLGEIIVPGSNKFGAIGLGSFGGYETLQVSRKTLTLKQRIEKRAFDLAVAIPLLIVLLPLFAITAIAIKLDSRGPVFFLQPRVGRGNRMFNVFKFRSMHTMMCDAAGNQSTLRGDPRITTVGRLLRSTSIDELPQLINVILGEMSIVGPRPHALGSVAEDRLFWEIDEGYWYRHRLKPGITGLAQVRGFRGATERRCDLVNRLQSDLEYIKKWSIWYDVLIVLGTAKVFVHRNAF
jgi:lipopolysaccharide/colanic/teichoic acid biosynthesis glycosyltransferase